jgi:AAA ATPase domain
LYEPAVADAGQADAISHRLVGRQEEIAMLMRRWERARQGDGQLVLIVGEPGLGKSRLVEELRIRLRDKIVDLRLALFDRVNQRELGHRQKQYLGPISNYPVGHRAAMCSPCNMQVARTARLPWCVI